MGFGKIVETPANAVAGVGGFLSNPFGLFDRTTPPTFFQRDDFPGGFIITPIVDGKEVPQRAARLTRNFMPMSPFVWGGSLRQSRDYYPGNPDPVTHVLGSKEDQLTVRCRWYAKKYPSDLREAPSEMVKIVDALRLSGDLLVIRMGDWKRYGRLVKTDFQMRTLADIEVSLTFDIDSFLLPDRSQIIAQSQRIPFDINTKLLEDLAAFQETYSVVPENTPGSLIDLLNDAISDAAAGVSAVTGFIDDVVTAVEDVAATYQRAIGAARFAMNSLLVFRRRLQTAVSSTLITSSSFLTMAEKYNISSQFQNASVQSYNLTLLLDSIRARFSDLVETLPLIRHRVTGNDTLQQLSIRYYGVAGNWQQIYDHNKLTTTELTVGAVLEIPRLT